MSVRILSELPTIFSSGETVKFARHFADFPSSDGWTYAFHMNGATATLHRDATLQDDGSFLVTISPADALPAGAYRYIERVTKDDEVHTVGDGVLSVELDLATAPAGATLSHNERTLQVIEAALEGRLSDDLQSYQIAGRAVVMIPIAELMKMRGIYKSLVFREHNPGQLGQSVEIQFSTMDESTMPPTWEESLS